MDRRKLSVRKSALQVGNGVFHTGQWQKFFGCGTETGEIKAGRQAKDCARGNSPNADKQVREFPVTLIREVCAYGQ